MISNNIIAVIQRSLSPPIPAGAQDPLMGRDEGRTGLGVRRPLLSPDLVSSPASDFHHLLFLPPHPLRSTLPACCLPARERGAGVLGSRPRGPAGTLYDLHSLANVSRPRVPPLRLPWQHLLPTRLPFMKPGAPREWWLLLELPGVGRWGADRLSCPCPHLRGLPPHPSDSFWPWSLWLNSGRPFSPPYLPPPPCLMPPAAGSASLLLSPLSGHC